MKSQTWSGWVLSAYVLCSALGLVLGYAAPDHIFLFLYNYLETHWLITLLPIWALGWVGGLAVCSWQWVVSRQRSWGRRGLVMLLFWFSAIGGGCAYFGLNGMDYMTWPEVVALSAYLGAGLGGLIGLGVVLVTQARGRLARWSWHKA